MKNYTNPLVRLLLFFLSVGSFFSCANGTQKLSMNSQQQRAIQVQQPPKANKLLYLLDSDIEYFLQRCGSTQQFREYFQGEAKGKNYREYVERNSKTEGMEPLEEAYSSERINLLDEYFGNRLCIKNIITKNTRSEKDMNELRLGSSPILISLIHYIEYNMPLIHEQKLGRKFIDALDLLINKGVNVNQADFLGNTAILELTTLADPTRKTIEQNSAELCIEEFHRKNPNNKDSERILNKIKTYAAKFKTSEEAKQEPSV